MKRFAILCLMFLVPVLAHAQVYKWVDENGRTVISDKPPPGAQATKKFGKGATSPSVNASPGTEQKSVAEQDMEFKKRRKEAEEKEAAQQAQEKRDAQQKANCDHMKSQLRMRESGQRVALTDDKGERYYLEDDQRAKEVEGLRQNIGSAGCAE